MKNIAANKSSRPPETKKKRHVYNGVGRLQSVVIIQICIYLEKKKNSILKLPTKE
jgi:hypothetical protein